MLKPQDIVVLAWLATHRSQVWRYADLAEALEMSPSECHAAVKRLVHAGLVFVPDDKEQFGIQADAVIDFLIHGVPRVYYAERGPLTRGVPTGVAAPPLAEQFQVGEENPVWPYPKGKARGYAFKPLYRSVPAAALRDPRLYEILALIDALRGGRARERKMAAELLRERLRDGS